MHLLNRNTTLKQTLSSNHHSPQNLERLAEFWPRATPSARHQSATPTYASRVHGTRLESVWLRGGFDWRSVEDRSVWKWWSVIGVIRQNYMVILVKIEW